MKPSTQICFSFFPFLLLLFLGKADVNQPKKVLLSSNNLPDSTKLEILVVVMEDKQQEPIRYATVSFEQTAINETDVNGEVKFSRSSVENKLYTFQAQRKLFFSSKKRVNIASQSATVFHTRKDVFIHRGFISFL